MDVAVDLDQVAAAGVAVEAVDVLGEHADRLEMRLESGDDGGGDYLRKRAGLASPAVAHRFAAVGYPLAEVPQPVYIHINRSVRKPGSFLLIDEVLHRRLANILEELEATLSNDHL